MPDATLIQRLTAEAVGTAMLLATVVGSGIQPEHAPAIIAAQLIGTVIAVLLARCFFDIRAAE